MGSIGDRIWEDEQVSFQATQLEQKAKAQKAIVEKILNEPPNSERMNQIIWIDKNFNKIMAMRRIIEKLEL